MKVNCFNCGKEFDCMGADRYCSAECKKEARRNREKVVHGESNICSFCNTLFIPENRSDQKYCSPECQTKAKSKRRIIVLTERICIVCGKSFMPVQNKQICCSSECVYKNHYLLNATKKKEQSKKWRQENPERARENDRRKRERDREKYRQIEAKSHDKLRFGGNRQFTLETDDFKCALCGATENLAVHHRDKSGNTNNPNNEITNLITLCSSCHTLVHNPRYDTTPHQITACQQCGKEMRISQVRIDDGRGKFCSKECQNASMVKKETITCQHCGKEFQVTHSRLKRGKVKYCSMECRKAAGYAWTGKNKNINN